MGKFRIVFLFIAVVCFSLGLFEGSASASDYAGSAKEAYAQLNPNISSSLVDWEYAWENSKGRNEEERPSLSWKPATSPLNPPDRDGRNILWLRTVLPEGHWKEPNLQLQVFQLFEVYVEGELIYKFGEIKDTGRSSYIGTPKRMISLPIEAMGKTMDIRVYSDSSDIGIRNHAIVAEQSDLILSQIKTQAHLVIFGCFYIIVGLISLYPYLRLKQKLLLVFSGFALSFGLYTITRTTLIYLFIDLPVVWMYIELASLILAVVFITVFIEQFFGGGYKGFLGIIWKIHLIYGVVFLLLGALGVISITKGLFVYQLLILLTVGFAIAHISQKALKGNKEAGMILIGTILFSATGIIDIVNEWTPNKNLPQVTYVGAFIQLIILIMILTRRMIAMQSRLSNSDKLSVAGQLAAGVAHEIRNPLTVISGYLQLMKNDIKNKPMIEVMLGEVNRINSIMNEFLFLAKPVKPKFAYQSMKHLLDNVLLLFKSQVEAYGIRLVLHCPEDIPKVYCDQNQLKQVFINVLKNAMEAMPGGGEIAIWFTEKAGVVTIVFQDQGCGIPEKELSQIGAPFYTTKENGNGLGLMVSRSIIENHKGRLRIESELEVGTKVIIELPIMR